jgi:hypothetical protein
VLWTVLLVGLATAAVAGTPVPAAKGKGRDASGLAFSFKYENGAGSVAFDTASFGSPTGGIDCYASVGRLAVMAGPLDVPVNGLTHFLVVAEDRKKLGGPDELALGLRGGLFDCEAELADTEPDALIEARDPIERSKIVVQPIN